MTLSGINLIYLFLHINFFFTISVRAKEKLEELERLLQIAKKNYTQLGGRLSEDRKRLQEIRDKDKLVVLLDQIKISDYWTLEIKLAW